MASIKCQCFLLQCHPYFAFATEVPMSLDDELKTLDQQWESERQAYMIQGGDNSAARVPTRRACIIGGVLVGGMGAFWGISAANMIAGEGFFASAFPWFGLLFMGAGVYYAVSGCIKAGKYQAGLRECQERRRQLTDRHKSPNT